MHQFDPTDIDLKTLNQMLDQAKRVLFRDRNAGFLSSLLGNIPIIWDVTCRTAQTSTKVIYVNPYWFTALPRETRATVIIHELWHIGLLHIPRGKNKDHELWNIACDIWINNMLKRQGYSFSGFAGYAAEYYDEDTSAEDIYADLVERQKREISIIEGRDDSTLAPFVPLTYGAWDGADIRSRNYCDRQDDKFVPRYENRAETSRLDMDTGLTEMEINEQVRLIHNATVMTSIARKIPLDEVVDLGGFGEGNLQSHIKQFLRPVVAWEKEIEHFAQDLHLSGTSYGVFNRRNVNSKFVFPGATMDLGGLEHFVMAMDSSGSCTQAHSRRFSSEGTYVHKTYAPEKMTLVQFDDSITSVEEFRQGEEIGDIVIKGGGGTNLAPVRQWILDNKPTAMVIFTDGRVEPMVPLELDMTNPPPILWIILGNRGVVLGTGRHVYIDE